MKYLVKVPTTVVMAWALFIAVPALAESPDLEPLRAEVAVLHAGTEQFIQQGQWQHALRSAQKAYDYSAEMLGAGDEATAVLGLSLANLLAAVASTREALQLYRLSLSRYEQLYGKESIETASVLVAMSEWLTGDEQVAAVRRALAIHANNSPGNAHAYAKVASRAGGYLALHEDTRSAAIPILEEAMRLLERESSRCNEQLISVLMALGDARATVHQPGPQKRLYKRAIELAKHSGDAEQLAELMLMAGTRLMEFSHSKEARTFLLQARKMYQKLYGAEDARTAYARLVLGRYYLSAGSYRQGLDAFKKSLSSFEQDDNYRNHQMTTLALIVDAYERLGERDEATNYCKAIGKIAPWTENQDIKPVYSQAAEYPRAAWKRQREGHVVLEFTVNKNGFVESQKIVESEGPSSFESSALAASNTFRYAPRFVQGQAVDTTSVRYTFVFNRSKSPFWNPPGQTRRSPYRLAVPIGD